MDGCDCCGGCIGSCEDTRGDVTRCRAEQGGHPTRPSSVPGSQSASPPPSLITVPLLSLSHSHRHTANHEGELNTATKLTLEAGISWPVQEETSDPLAAFFQPGSVS